MKGGHRISFRGYVLASACIYKIQVRNIDFAHTGFRVGAWVHGLSTRKVRSVLGSLEGLGK